MEDRPELQVGTEVVAIRDIYEYDIVAIDPENFGPLLAAKGQVGTILTRDDTYIEVGFGTMVVGCYIYEDVETLVR